MISTFTFCAGISSAVCHCVILNVSSSYKPIYIETLLTRETHVASIFEENQRQPNVMVTTNYISDSDTESFHSFNDDEPGPPASETPNPTRNGRTPSTSRFKPTKPVIERFPPDEEASLLAESNSIKGNGNQLFGTGSFENALQTYDRALASCPNYLDYEVAVLRSNVAACYLKLEEWKEAIESATKGLDCLERLEPLPEVRKKAKEAAEGTEGEEGAVEEVDEEVAERIENLQKSGRTLDEVRKLQIKLLLRRAKARTSTTSWTNLQGADEDYHTLLSPTVASSLSPTDRRSVNENVRQLGPKLNAAKEREMAEMMQNLKGIGNSILKPFGLSTENFKFQKDEKTGGYSMGFEQGGSGEGKT